MYQIIPQFLSGHTWGRKALFFLHLDIHSICMNRRYTSHIFPALRKNASECTTPASAFHKYNRLSQPLMADACIHHTPKWRGRSCFQTTGSFPNTTDRLSSTILVWMEACLHPAAWHAGEVLQVRMQKAISF